MAFLAFVVFVTFVFFLAFVVVLDLNPSLNTCKYNTPHVYNLLYTIYIYMTYIYMIYMIYMIYIYISYPILSFLIFLILSYIILYYIILYCIIYTCGIFKTLISNLKPDLNAEPRKLGRWKVSNLRSERKGPGRKWWHLGRKGQRLHGSPRISTVVYQQVLSRLTSR